MSKMWECVGVQGCKEKSGDEVTSNRGHVSRL